MLKIIFIISLTIMNLANANEQESTKDFDFTKKTKEEIRMCVENCLAIYDKPGAELKMCLSKCDNLKD